MLRNRSDDGDGRQSCARRGLVRHARPGRAFTPSRMLRARLVRRPARAGRRATSQTGSREILPPAAARDDAVLRARDAPCRDAAHRARLAAQAGAAAGDRRPRARRRGARDGARPGRAAPARPRAGAPDHERRRGVALPRGAGRGGRCGRRARAALHAHAERHASRPRARRVHDPGGPCEPRRLRRRGGRGARDRRRLPSRRDARLPGEQLVRERFGYRTKRCS